MTSTQQVILERPRDQFTGLEIDFEVNVHAEKLHLSSIHSNDAFTTLRNPEDPSRKIRVKKTNWCDPSVKYLPFSDTPRKMLSMSV
jgi:hypothetical protein